MHRKILLSFLAVVASLSGTTAATQANKNDLHGSAEHDPLYNGKEVLEREAWPNEELIL